MFNVMIIHHFNMVNTVESRYLWGWHMSHKFDTVESGHTQRNFHNATPICILFEKSAWTLEETESVLFNLGKCWKPKGMNKPRMQKRGYKEKPGTHFKMCVIKVRSLVSSIYSRWSQPPCPNLTGSVNLNQPWEKLKLRQLNANYEGQSLSESKEIKAREPWVHMQANLVPRPSPPPTACICILQATKNWSRGKHGNEIISISHAYVN